MRPPIELLIVLTTPTWIEGKKQESRVKSQEARSQKPEARSQKPEATAAGSFNKAKLPPVEAVCVRPLTLCKEASLLLRREVIRVVRSNRFKDLVIHGSKQSHFICGVEIPSVNHPKE